MITAYWTLAQEKVVAYSGLHLNEKRKKVGWSKRSVSGRDEHAGN